MTDLNDTKIQSFLHPHLLESEQVVRWANGLGHPRKGIVIICIIILVLLLLVAAPVAIGLVYGLSMALGIAGALIGGVFVSIPVMIAVLPSAILYFLFKRKYIVVLTNLRIIVLNFTGELKSKEVVAFELLRLPPITIKSQNKFTDIHFKADGFSRIISFPLNTPGDNAIHNQALIYELQQYLEHEETVDLSARNGWSCGQISSDTEISAAGTSSNQKVAESDSLTTENHAMSSKKALIVKGCGWLLFIPSLLFIAMLILGTFIGGIKEGEFAITVFTLLLFSLPVIAGIGLIYKGGKTQQTTRFHVNKMAFQQEKPIDAKGNKYLLIISVLLFLLVIFLFPCRIWFSVQQESQKTFGNVPVYSGMLASEIMLTILPLIMMMASLISFLFGILPGAKRRIPFYSVLSGQASSATLIIPLLFALNIFATNKDIRILPSRQYMQLLGIPNYFGSWVVHGTFWYTLMAVIISFTISLIGFGYLRYRNQCRAGILAIILGLVIGAILYGSM